MQEADRKKLIENLTLFRGMITVGYEFNQAHGPRSVYAKVVLSASPADEYTFESEAIWPQSDNYEEAIRKGITDALNTNTQSALGIKITLKEIGWHEVSSNEIGFYQAAKLARIGILAQCGYKELDGI